MTDGWANRRTDRVAYSVACLRLKTCIHVRFKTCSPDLELCTINEPHQVSSTYHAARHARVKGERVKFSIEKQWILVQLAIFSFYILFWGYSQLGRTFLDCMTIAGKMPEIVGNEKSDEKICHPPRVCLDLFIFHTSESGLLIPTWIWTRPIAISRGHRTLKATTRKKVKWDRPTNQPTDQHSDL